MFFFGMPFLKDPELLLYVSIAAVPVLPTTLALVAAILVWVAFLRPDWSDSMLFSAAMILTTIFFLGGIDALTQRFWGRPYTESIVCTDLVAYGTWLAMAHVRKKPALAILCICAIGYSIFFTYYLGANVISIVGGALMGGAVLSFGGYLAKRAGINPLTSSQ